MSDATTQVTEERFPVNLKRVFGEDGSFRKAVEIALNRYRESGGDISFDSVTVLVIITNNASCAGVGEGEIDLHDYRIKVAQLNIFREEAEPICFEFTKEDEMTLQDVLVTFGVILSDDEVILNEGKPVDLRLRLDPQSHDGMILRIRPKQPVESGAPAAQSIGGGDGD